MFRWPNKAVFFLSGFFPFLLLCCAFADLRPIGISTVPDDHRALLPGAESPVIVRFDTEMEKSTVEKAIQIYSPGGIADGELRWEGRELHFIPSAPWKAGIRYALKLSGTVSARDGRELPLSMDIPFYAVSRSSLPYVRSFFPPDGASVGCCVPVGCFPSAGCDAYADFARSGGAAESSEAAILELNFSHSMDIHSTGDALKLDIPGEKNFVWLDDDKTLRISSDKPLNPWAIYRWSISEKALSRDGAPLAKEVTGRFVTDLDREFIKVLRLVPLMQGGTSALLGPGTADPFAAPSSPGGTLWGAWIPAALSLAQGPGSGQGIGIEFNKPPEGDSLRRAFSFVPSLPGRVEMLSPVSAVFIPSRDPEPETVYSLCISGALRDMDGLKMGEDYTVSFKTDIPFLRVLSFSSGEGEAEFSPEPGGLFSVPVNTGGIIQFVIYFSLPFDSVNPAVREECVFRISLRPFFPGILPPVSLRTARWISSDRLLLEWEGLEGGLSGEPHYYRLLIPGGSGGVHNGHGSYLKDDFILYLEAEE